MVHILHKGASTIHLDDNRIKADVHMLMHMGLCNHTMIFLLIRYRNFLPPFMANIEAFLLKLFQGQGVFQNDSRANSSKTSHKTKHTNSLQGVHCYQYHNKHSGVSHTDMPFFL